MDEDRTTLAIDVRGLVKRYGDSTALDGLDLTVERSCFHGLLGPNGAGKTTTVRILSTLARPDAGTARVLDHDVVAERRAVRPNVGLVFQESTLDPHLTAREHLDLYARLYHLADRTRRVGEGLELVGLTHDADRQTRTFSGGMKRRLEIARGLLHRPRVLFLDEPTLGLDVRARAGVWSHLRALHAAGETTIFLTTHSMEEADSLCERIAIVDRGRRVASGTPEALKSELGGDVVRLSLAQVASAREVLARVSGVAEVTAEDATSNSGEGTLRITVADGPRRLADLIEAAKPFGVREVTLHRPTLEHVFLHHTGRSFETEEVAP